MRQDNNKTPPVKIGDEVKVHIQAVGEKGDGIAKKQGFVIFIPKSSVGDFVKVRITKVLAKVCFGEVVEKLEAPKAKQIVPPPKKESLQGEATEDFGEE